MSRLLLPVLLLFAGCRKEAADGPPLISEVRRTLAERERRLGSYHLVAESTAGEAVATHAFFFRSPNKLRGVVLHPARLEWSFDGQKLSKLEPASKKFSTYALKLPPDKAAMFLNSTFSPFVTEGFRTPLMPSKGVKATRVTHPQGPEAVELTVELGPKMTVTYVLRWPGADFLSRRTQADGSSSTLEVVEEQCEPQLKLCVPKVTRELQDGTRVLTTRLTQIELNPELPAEGFTPTMPEGWTAETHEVVESASP